MELFHPGREHVLAVCDCIRPDTAFGSTGVADTAVVGRLPLCHVPGGELVAGALTGLDIVRILRVGTVELNRPYVPV